MSADTCPLCNSHGGELVWQSALYRVVLVDDAAYPGFCRVILNRHAAEMTDLPAAERDTLMQAVWTVESVLRDAVHPDKINLASLGNVVPHLHWHVIPRWHDDAHFPSPIWATTQRDSPPRNVDLTALKASLASRLLLLESMK
ncbi:HIT family protein [Chitinimonas sp. BJYL2]|uniref:HIT family protein n=1 Tax=Chitinimonas sp. BJYL2 TaxID=2976696 RepID=UPI0022B30CFA|nr:HIT family protein [Chitinimonas sp. BJYL2]